MALLSDLINPKLRYSKKFGFLKWSRPNPLLTPIVLYSIFIVFMLMIYVYYPMKTNKIDENLEESKIQMIPNLNAEEILTNAFSKADSNGDTKLTLQELARYINAKIRDHIENAIETNPLDFSIIDVSPKDGLINWDEYQRYFLRLKGYSSEFQEGKSSYSKLKRHLKGMDL